MRMTFSLPDALARRFLAGVPFRERSATIAKLLEQELAKRDNALAATCQAANADTALTADIDAWQAFEDDAEEYDE